MRYEAEIALLRTTFKKIHMQTALVEVKSLAEAMLPFGEFVGAAGRSRLLEKIKLPPLKEKTLYRRTDAYGCSFLYIPIFDGDRKSVLLLGPYFHTPLTAEDVLEISEHLGVAPRFLRRFREYVQSVPVAPSDSHIFFMLDAFCEQIFETNAFAVVETNEQKHRENSPVHAIGEGVEGELLDIKALEMRYSFENELIDAVASGQIHKEALFLTAFSEEAFEKRLPDQLRNSKNYAIILNTLLRKGAERGGVHPFYLDRVSSDFARRIERLTTQNEGAALMADIFRSYCRLVRKHAMNSYSPQIQQTLLTIDGNLSAALSSRMLAENAGVSLGYLCTAFKKEIGKTITAYIREKRIAYAAHLLSTTALQIQTVALHVGIDDVQYFSKLFRREMRKSPQEYRTSLV